MRIIFNIVLQVQQSNVMLERLWLELRMENDLLNAHNLEWFRLFVASQAPLASLDQHIVVSVTVNWGKLKTR